jgi:hypothetical protein
MYIGIPTADGGIIITTDAGTFTCFITPCQGKIASRASSRVVCPVKRRARPAPTA